MGLWKRNVKIIVFVMAAIKIPRDIYKINGYATFPDGNARIIYAAGPSITKRTKMR